MNGPVFYVFINMFQRAYLNNYYDCSSCVCTQSTNGSYLILPMTINLMTDWSVCLCTQTFSVIHFTYGDSMVGISSDITSDFVLFVIIYFLRNYHSITQFVINCLSTCLNVCLTSWFILLHYLCTTGPLWHHFYLWPS